MATATEPDFLSQCGEALTPGQRREWFRFEAFQAEEKGATFHRYSVHPDIPNLILYEGWKERPDEQGEQRWQFVAV